MILLLDLLRHVCRYAGTVPYRFRCPLKIKDEKTIPGQNVLLVLAKIVLAAAVVVAVAEAAVAAVVAVVAVAAPAAVGGGPGAGQD